jgi:tRNA A-37 threonylcarbamoyl transferase component Bud32
MAVLEKQAGKFRVLYYSSFLEPVSLIRNLFQSRVIAHKGRGGIRIVETGGLTLVVRKYVHGGLFRAFTGDLFLTGKRVVSEAETMLYLQERGFPVVAPFAAIVERGFILKRLYLVTLFEEHAVSLLEYLQASGKRQRMGVAKRLARLLWELRHAGVYHPDLHPGNVLVTPDGRLLFLDFDRAVRKSVRPRDARSMIRRLCRFGDKMERQGLLATDRREKALFLRAYGRLAGEDMAARMGGGEKLRGYLHRAGWRIESALFGERKCRQGPHFPD